MNHNPYNLVKGDYAVIDAGGITECRIIIEHVGNIFAFVYPQESNPSEGWHVMLNRITPAKYDLSDKTGQHVLYEYLRKACKGGKNELRIAFQDELGHFIIHPHGESGKTLDFVLTRGDVL